jgi:hypothetical protein
LPLRAYGDADAVNRFPQRGRRHLVAHNNMKVAEPACTTSLAIVRQASPSKGIIATTTQDIQSIVARRIKHGSDAAK